jgi:hypothetical protein
MTDKLIINAAISEHCDAEKYQKYNAVKLDFSSSEAVSAYFEALESDFSLFIFENVIIKEDVLEKILRENADFALLYSEYYDNVKTYIPLCDYSDGSVRDDFDFGKCIIVSTRLAKEAVKNLDKSAVKAGFYDFRLQMSRLGRIIKTESFYTLYNNDDKDFETSHFAYCEPRNQEYQKEAEKVFTKYLRQTGAFIQPVLSGVKDFDNIVNSYKTRLSVIIPVKNRPNTIKDAINSALSQQTDFQFNVIVIDNHSDTETFDAIESEKDPRLVHLVPERTDLEIGGCWNYGIENENCGAFAVQLDSDDVYSNPHVLQKIHDTFIKEKCGVLIGSYRLTDFSLKPITDFIIDHKEYTEENGVNNALRINGFGAPRCYLTSLIRIEKFKNYSYGEDYDLCLRLSRKYKLSRIFEVLYLCRRWGGNSDANLTPEKITKNNSLKDSFRTEEINKRK